MAFNSMPPIISKYRNSPSPNFPRTKRGSFLDSLEKQRDNASNQSYNPNYEALKKPLTLGIPDFKRYISREQQENLREKLSLPRPESYDHEKISTAYTMLSDYKRT